MKKLIQSAVLFTTLSFYLIGCTTVSTPLKEKIAPPPESKQASTASKVSTNTPSPSPRTTWNNGTPFVSYKDNVYYWKYNEESFEKGGLFQTYNSIPTTKNQLACLDSNGDETIIYEGIGYGNIYILNDEIYVAGDDAEGNPYFFTLTDEGVVKKTYQNARILDIYSQENIIVYEKYDSTQRSLCTLDTQTKESNLLIEGEVTYLTQKNGSLYYFDYPKETKSSCQLHRIPLTGGTPTLLANVGKDLKNANYLEITDIDFINDTIYFIYGYYGGTGHFWQEGVIASVKMDGTNFKQISIVNDGSFSILEDKQGTALIVVTQDSNDEDPSIYSIHLPNNVKKKYDANVFEVNVPFFEEGKIAIYPDSSGKKEIIISDLNFQESKEISISVTNINYVNGWVYYSIQESKYDKDYSVGWRDGYQRIRTQVFRQKPGDTKSELLYKF